ncbi:MAG: GNAT family N-acetyltransferase [Flaviflexus sp.]
MSLLPEYRGLGIGSELLGRLLELLQEKGFERASLSCQVSNPAYRLYQRMGFETLRLGDGDAVMVIELEKSQRTGSN